MQDLGASENRCISFGGWHTHMLGRFVLRMDTHTLRPIIHDSVFHTILRLVLDRSNSRRCGIMVRRDDTSVAWTICEQRDRQALVCRQRLNWGEEEMAMPLRDIGAMCVTTAISVRHLSHSPFTLSHLESSKRSLRR